jgi:hypothetical protein
MLFVKEVDDQRYQQICGVRAHTTSHCFADCLQTYFAASSALYRQEISELLRHFKAFVRKASDDDAEACERTNASPFGDKS